MGGFPRAVSYGNAEVGKGSGMSRQDGNPRVDQDGEDLLIVLHDSACLETRIMVRGRSNQLIVEAGVTVTAFAPAGFAATVPEPAPLVGHSLVIDGQDNVVRIGTGARLGVNMVIRGNGNRVEIGERCHLHGFINVLCDDAKLVIGAATTMVQGSIQLHEPGEIVIGSDCMISSQVYLSLSDIHPIYDRVTGNRINLAAPIHIGDHVWLGLRSMVMKGARIGEGAVVAAGSIVSGQVPSRTVVAGAPARIVRQEIEWRRDFTQAPPEPQMIMTSPPPQGLWTRLKAWLSP